MLPIPIFGAKALVARILWTWARDFARRYHKKFVRLDTVGENHGLIAHYTACGFTYLGLATLTDTAGLPAHYHNATVSLFELAGAGLNGYEHRSLNYTTTSIMRQLDFIRRTLGG